MFPKRRFCTHVAETCTRKGGFGYILAGADGFEPPVAESESAALPLGEAPIMAGTKGFEPLQNDLESFVLAITPSSLKWRDEWGLNPRPPA